MSETYLFQDNSLSAEERAIDLVSHLSLGEKITMVTSHQAPIPRLGIAGMHVGVEVARGLVQRDNKRETTILPQPWGMAATFDPDLMEAAGSIVGDEIRISNQMADRPSSLFLFGPTVDLLRDPRWGRNEEAYSEDPCLNGQMTAAYTRGLAGNDPKYLKSAPLLKHFYANNYENERTTTNASITPRLKHDYYLKGFEPAIRDGGAAGLMTAYNCINGIEALNNPDVKHICKDQWGMTLAVSDGGDFGQNVASHRSYATHAESIAAILGIGADLMLDSHDMVDTAVEEALERGLLSEANLDAALTDLFKLRFKLGEFDPAENPYSRMDPSLLASPSHKQIAVKLAEESMILLENKGLLPLTDDGRSSIAVVGPLSDENYTCWYCGFAENQTTVVEGMREKLGTERVYFDEGFDHIILKSEKSGRYIRLDENGVLVANATAEDAEVFERNDWDYGSWTLRSLRSGRYISESDGSANQDSETDETIAKIELDPPLICNATAAFGWFVKEWFKVSESDGSLFLKSWQDRTILVDSANVVRAAVGHTHDEASRFTCEIVSSGSDRVAALAAKADTVMVCAGNHPLINAREEYDRPDLNLPQAQSQLLTAAVEANENTLLYLITGYPFSINQEKQQAKAVLCSTHLGPSLGHVAARTVFGENNPAGRTPTTWYHSVRDLPALDDYDIMKNNMTYLYFDGKPLYPFGYGLSYSEFTYSDFAVDQTILNVDEQVSLTVTIENTGLYDGDEVVQVYVIPPKSIFKRPRKMLKAFSRVELKRGESRTVTLSFAVSDLSFWNTEIESFIVENGDYIVEVGRSSEHILAHQQIHINGQDVNGRNAQKLISAIDTEDYHRVEFLTDKQDGLPYLEARDFRSYAVYPGLDLKDANRFEARVSSPAGQMELLLVNNKNGEILGTCTAKGSGSLTRFTVMTCSLAPQNHLMDLRIVFTKQTSLKNFRFYRE